MQAGGDVAVGRLLGERQLQGADGGRVGAGGGLEQVGDDGDAAPRAGAQAGALDEGEQVLPG